MWYSNRQIRSYNRLFMFTIGPRGPGKTFSFKEWGIDDFMKKGKQFIYVRRYQNEIDKIKKNFWNAMKPHYPDLHFKMDGQLAMISDYPYTEDDEENYNEDEFKDSFKVAGYLIALSTSGGLKSNDYPDVDKIGFDEFIIGEGSSRYIKNEVTLFLEFYETVARMREDVKVHFLANAVSVVNPYFLFWNIKPLPNKRFTKYPQIIVEFFADKEFIEKKKATPFGQLIEGTEYAAYAIENKFLRDNDQFLEKRPKTAKYHFRIIYNNQTFGIWYEHQLGRFYVSNNFDPSYKKVYTISSEEHGENTMLIRNPKKYYGIRLLIEGFECGAIRFDTIQIKNQMFEIFRKIC